MSSVFGTVTSGVTNGSWEQLPPIVCRQFPYYLHVMIFIGPSQVHGLIPYVPLRSASRARSPRQEDGLPFMNLIASRGFVMHAPQFSINDHFLGARFGFLRGCRFAGCVPESGGCVGVYRALQTLRGWACSMSLASCSDSDIDFICCIYI